MPLDMFDSSGITQAIRLLCQSRVLLTANCSASGTVTVGSTELFRPATGPAEYPITGLTVAATLDDSNSDSENVTITQITSDTTLVLHQACAGAFTTAQEATIGLATPRVTLGSSATVTESPFPHAMAVSTATLPRIAVLEQAGAQGPATNKQYAQTRLYRILYARQEAKGEESEQQLKTAVQALCNLLMEDYALGGTVDASWVSGWDYQPPERALYDGEPILVAAVELTAEIWSLWNK